MERSIIEPGQPNKGNSNPKTALVLTILLAIAILAGLIFLFRYFSKSEEKIVAKVSHSEILLNEDLLYADNTVGGKTWLWEFGNGDTSSKQQGEYRFQKAGSYVVRLTVNNNLREQFMVRVKDTVAALMPDTTLFIAGPKTGMMFEEIRLEANGPGEIFEWWFGETGRVDVVGKSAFYTYSKPGKYQVRLKSDRQAAPVFYDILIEDPNLANAGPMGPGDGAGDALLDLKKQIQRIANGEDFESIYRYILSKHLCQNEKVKVQVEMEGNKKQMDIYAYLIGLTFSKSISIDEVSVSSLVKRGEDTECPTLLTVKQSK